MSWFNKKPEEKVLRAVNGDVQAYVVLDVSGSMGGRELRPDKLTAAKNASIGYVEQLRKTCPQARASVVSYADRARMECKALSVSGQFDLICKSIKRLKTRGCTDIGRALQQVHSSLGRQANSASIHVVLLSDGFHNGSVNPVPIAEKLKRHKSLRIDCVGIGSRPGNVDVRLLKSIASRDEKGPPRYHFIEDSMELLEHFKKLAGYLSKE